MPKPLNLSAKLLGQRVQFDSSMEAGVVKMHPITWMEILAMPSLITLVDQSEVDVAETASGA